MCAARYELLTSEHLREWGDDRSADDMVGLALRGGDGQLLALGGVWWVDGRHWAMFDARPGCTPLVHRAAIHIVRALADAGETAIYAVCDESRPRARKWLERFGFALIEDGVWRLDLCGSPDNRQGRDIGFIRRG